ncbi:PH domain-containing protein [Pedobacter sp. Du54]|uniref:PH domain-containing protein n=1 Tax=Pedobacter anseongensis TaxID=3133439 RepID=UPI0030A69EF1
MMNFDFSKPQRQSISGIIIMGAHTLQHFIRALFIPLAIFVIKATASVLMYVVIGLAVLIVVILFFSYLSYRRFTFFLDDKKQEFVINKGVFNRTLLTIQLDKIQQVNINQSLLQKLIGVYSLQIDTPGTASSEVSMKAISKEIAYSLKEHLLNGEKVSSSDVLETNTATQKQTLFLKLSARTLFKVGLTSNYLSSLILLMGFLYAIFHNAKELIRAFDNDNGQVEAAIKTGVSVFSVGILVAIFLCILLIINIIRTFVTYFDFEVSKHKHSLLLSFGLFARKNTLVNPRKVQITNYSQNYFQKKLNIINLLLMQAHTGEKKEEKDVAKSFLHIPGCSKTEKDELLRIILGDMPKEGKIFTPNFRFLNLPLFFKAIIPIGIFFTFWFNFNQLKPYYPLAICYFILVVSTLYISYKRHRLVVSKDFIIKKSGIWDISHQIIVPHKIQSITTFQYPWHKSVDVGHVNLHTAAGVIHFKYGNYTEIKQLVNYWLYQIESGSEEWM